MSQPLMPAGKQRKSNSEGPTSCSPPSLPQSRQGGTPLIPPLLPHSCLLILLLCHSRAGTQQYFSSHALRDTGALEVPLLLLLRVPGFRTMKRINTSTAIGDDPSIALEILHPSPFSAFHYV